MLRIVFQAEKGHRQSFIYIFRTIFRCKVALHVFFELSLLISVLWSSWKGTDYLEQMDIYSNYCYQSTLNP